MEIVGSGGGGGSQPQQSSVPSSVHQQQSHSSILPPTAVGTSSSTTSSTITQHQQQGGLPASDVHPFRNNETDLIASTRMLVLRDLRRSIAVSDCASKNSQFCIEFLFKFCFLLRYLESEPKN
jgi:hypothetical protein